MSTEIGSGDSDASSTARLPSKLPKKAPAKKTGAKKAPAKKTVAKKAAAKKPSAKKPAAKKVPQPGRGKILIWSVDFPARDPDDPEQPTPSVIASVTLDDQEGLIQAKAASVIDYQSGAISNGALVEVRYESPEDESSDDPAWVFDLVDGADSNVS